MKSATIVALVVAAFAFALAMTAALEGCATAMPDEPGYVMTHARDASR